MLNNLRSLPTWILGGIILSIIACLSIAIIAVLLTTLDSQDSEAEQTATAEIIAQNATREAEPTDEIRFVIGTAQPTPTTLLLATPTQIALPTFIITNSGSGSGNVPGNNTNITITQNPQQDLINYFQLVTSNQNEAWAQLTDRFKQKYNCCAPGYDIVGYTEWWNSVERVEFEQINLVSQSGTQAVIFAKPIYRMKDGGEFVDDIEPYFLMVYDSLVGKWLLDNRGTTPELYTK